jgi:hypothetical protein
MRSIGRSIGRSGDAVACCGSGHTEAWAGSRWQVSTGSNARSLWQVSVEVGIKAVVPGVGHVSMELSAATVALTGAFRPHTLVSVCSSLPPPLP